MDDCPINTDTPPVDASIGLAIPPSLQRLYQLLQGSDGNFNGDRGSFFHRVTGLMHADTGDSLPGTPPELFIIGRTGMDAMTCGYVVHDTRLSAEVPLAMFDPAVGRGDYLGLDTRRSLGVLMGMQYAQSSKPVDESILEIIESMHFSVEELPEEPILNVSPRIPPGWRMAMTADGLGVIAENRFFAPGQEYDQEIESFEPPDPDEVLSVADSALTRGHAATALWHLRNAYTFCAPDHAAVPLVGAMMRAYDALGRGLLREHLRHLAALMESGR